MPPAEAPAPSAVPFVVGFHGTPPVVGGTFAGAEVVLRDDALRFARVLAPSPAAFVAEAWLDPAVRYVERAEPQRMGASGVAQVVPADDPRLPEQYALHQIRAQDAWNVTTGSAEVDLCFVGTGVRATHQEFASGRIRAQRDFVNGDADASDDNGTGTLLASVAAGGMGDGLGTAGVAQVPLLVAKALGRSGSGTVDGVARAVAWCADVGGPRTVVSLSVQVYNGHSQVLADAVAYAIGKGALVVAPAGLDGPCEACVSFPATIPGVLTVGCTQEGETSCPHASVGPEVDLVEPGRALLGAWHTADDAYAILDHMTFSIAHASGAAALYWGHRPELNATDVLARLVDSAQDLGAPGHDATHGCGELDLANALSGASFARCAGAPPCVPGSTYDCFADRHVFTPGSFSITLSTVGATREPHEPSPCGMGPSVWFSFRAEENGTARLSTWDSEFDTALAVYQGETISSLVSIDCDARWGSPGAGLSFSCRAGETYHVQAGGEGEARGLLRLIQSGCAPARLGAPTQLRTAQAGIRQLSLSWDPPFTTGSDPVTGYRVYAGSACDALDLAAETGTWPRSFHDRAPDDATLRCYRVSAVDASGAEGPLSEPLTAVPPDVPSAPRDFAGEPRADRGVRLSWRAPEHDGGRAVLFYTLYESTGGAWRYLASLPADATVYEDARVTPLAVKFRLEAQNWWGPSEAVETCVRPGPWPGGDLQLCDLYDVQAAIL